MSLFSKTSGLLSICILIGWANTRLYVIAPKVAKSTGFENQNNGGWIVFCWLKLFCLDIFDQLYLVG